MLFYSPTCQGWKGLSHCTSGLVWWENCKRSKLLLSKKQLNQQEYPINLFLNNYVSIVACIIFIFSSLFSQAEWRNMTWMHVHDEASKSRDWPQVDNHSIPMNPVWTTYEPKSLPCSHSKMTLRPHECTSSNHIKILLMSQLCSSRLHLPSKHASLKTTDRRARVKISECLFTLKLMSIHLNIYGVTLSFVNLYILSEDIWNWKEKKVGTKEEHCRESLKIGFFTRQRTAMRENTCLTCYNK